MMKMSQAISMFGMSDAARVLDGLRAQLGPGSFPETAEEVPTAPAPRAETRTEKAPRGRARKGQFLTLSTSAAPGYKALGLLGALRSNPDGSKNLRLIYASNPTGRPLRLDLDRVKADLGPGETLVEGVAVKGPGLAGISFAPIGARFGLPSRGVPALDIDSDVRACGKLGKFLGVNLSPDTPTPIPQPDLPREVSSLDHHAMERMPQPRRLLLGEIQTQAMRRVEMATA